MKTTDDQKEMFIVVDNNDNLLGYKTRYECHHDKTIIHRTIGLLVYNSKGEILLQKRSKTKDLNPGMWAIGVGGHVTKGQTYDEAAFREMKEELGIKTEIQPIKIWLMETDQEKEMAMLYQAIYEGPYHVDPSEVEEVKYFSKRILRQSYNDHTLNLSPCAILTLKEVNIL
jgi:isopentenyl-diphosphate delta-isomerase type 1